MSGKKKKQQLQAKRALNKPKIYEDSESTPYRVDPIYNPIKSTTASRVNTDSEIQIRNNFPISHIYHTVNYPIPKRPSWDAQVSKSVLEQREETYFKAYLDSFKRQGATDICFEMDLEVHIFFDY
jgi:hypothetical protein